MASIKKKSATKKPAESSWTWASLIGWTKPLLALFSLAVVAFGFSAGRSALRDQFVRQNPSELSITPLPDWIAPAGSPAKLVSSADLSHTSARKLTQLLEASLWVRSVKIARRSTGFHAEIEYRRPVLAVAWGDGRYCFTDRDGIALDVETLTARGGGACLILKGAESKGFPAAGELLPDSRVLDIGKLAEKLQAVREPLQLETILLATGSKSRFPRVEILTRTEGRVLWGELGKNDEKKLAQLVERTRLGATLSKGESWDLDQPGSLPVEQANAQTKIGRNDGS
jgi:hypothetical protein